MYQSPYASENFSLSRELALAARFITHNEAMAHIDAKSTRLAAWIRFTLADYKLRYQPSLSSSAPLHPPRSSSPPFSYLVVVPFAFVDK